MDRTKRSTRSKKGTLMSNEWCPPPPKYVCITSSRYARRGITAPSCWTYRGRSTRQSASQRGDVSTVDTVDFPSPEASDIHPPVDATIPPDD